MRESDTNKRGRGRAVRTFLLWSGFALAVLLLLISSVIFASYRSAGRRVVAELNRVRENSEPTDDASMADWFQSMNHSQGTVAWQRIIAKTQSLINAQGTSLRQLPSMGVNALPEFLNPGDTWQEEPQVAEFLALARPIMDSVNDAREHPTPVWFPIDFNGFDTQLPEIQASRDLARILQFETFHALYHRDTRRASQALHSMRLTADAFDWKIFVFSHLVHQLLENMSLDTLGKSLDFGLWSDKELQEWMEQLEHPANVSKDWRETFAGERYAFLSESNHLRQPSARNNPVVIDRILQLPHAKLKLLQFASKAQELGEGELSDLVQRCTQFQADVDAEVNWSQFSPGGIALGYLGPAYSAIATAFERQEDSRRMVRTALAIKLFQLRNGTWPASLDELAQVEATQSDWHTLNKGTFGYTYDDGHAWLWSYSQGGASSQVPSTRPEPTSDPQFFIPLYRIK